VLVIGLGVSLAALFATNKGFNDKIAELNNQAAGFNQKAAASELEAADARKETEQLSKNEQALKTRADEAELELARITGPSILFR
jgi:predicted  nucleic acid-binding Zn-ribbon protein